MSMRALILASLAASAASAAPLDVQVRGPGGQPVADAVVMVQAPHPAGPIRFPWPMTMAQKDISFQPHVLIVPVGATVSFPNMDSVRHHVYSFSKPKKFELKLYGQDQTRTVVFDKPGVIALGCNIHDAMSGFILAVDTPYAGKTDASGHVRLDVPAGAVTLQLWSPLIRAPNNLLSQPLTVPANGLAKAVTVGP